MPLLKNIFLLLIFSLTRFQSLKQNEHAPGERKYLDLAYASLSPAQKMDIYLPDSTKGLFPVILYIHGGAFKFGDKADKVYSVMLEVLRKGYAVVYINYRLSGEARFPAQIQDVKAAIRFVRAHAGDYSLNADKIVAWGESAGGYLAALAGTSGNIKALEDPGLGNPEQSSRVQAVVDMFGPIDFLTMDDQFAAGSVKGMLHNGAESPESQLLGKQITLIPELVKKSNPETYISKDDPPFYIQHGSVDPVIPVQQSVHFADELKKTIGKNKVILDLLPKEGHATDGFWTKENINKILVEIDKHFMSVN